SIFLTYLVPPTLLFIPLSRVVVNLHLDDSLWSLVLVYPSFTVPFSAWLMMGFFKAIPKDVEEAAMVDGYSRLGAFFRVVVPISLAGILTVAIFSFTLVMQEFVYAVTFISSVRNMTVSVGVPTFLVHGDVYFWGSLMAGCFIASVPVAILYNFFVDRFIAGFTMGAIKYLCRRILENRGIRLRGCRKPTILFTPASNHCLRISANAFISARISLTCSSSRSSSPVA